MIVIPLTVAARNEARAIGACLDSLRVAIDRAEAVLPVRLAPLVVLDECTDGTGQLARERGFEVLESAGGKIEAQRAGNRPGPCNVFSDADILLSPEALVELLRPILERSDVQVTFADKQPLPPRSRSLLARALHLYNLNHGYSSERRWFSGKLFAIRSWEIPRREELARACLPPGGFYDLHAGLLADDVYLSRLVMRRYGPSAFMETRGRLFFRAPETFEGMYRYYRRLRMETERVDLLCPETRGVYERFGRRREDLIRSAPVAERCLHIVFTAALAACRARYGWERWLLDRADAPSPDFWPPVEESKCL